MLFLRYYCIHMSRNLPEAPVMVMIPSLAPKHVTSVGVTVAASTAGSVMTSAGLRVITHAVLAASLIRTS